MRSNATDIQSYLNQRFGLSDDLSGIHEHLAELYGPPDDLESADRYESDDEPSRSEDYRRSDRSYLEL